MAITGKFIADFTDFQNAVAKAEVSLRSFETGAGKVGSALNKMADSFSGRKIVSDAELATKAVMEIGGATKLTIDEQAKLNVQLTIALDKYKALGIQAPEDMLKLKNETQGAADAMAKVPAQTESILGGLSKIAGAIGIGFSVGAIINFGKAVLDNASHIKVLSDQLGISTDAVQEFKYAAEQGGSSLESVGTAIEKMNENLAGGSKSTVQALTDAGLKFADIRQMKPEDAFLAITDAIQQIKDPMLQASVAVELFGKKGAELLPQIKEGFRDAGKAASKMSEDTIKDLEASQQAWENFKTRVLNFSGELAGGLIKDAEKATRSWKDFFTFLGSFTPTGTRRVLPELPQDINLPVETKPGKTRPVLTADELKREQEHLQALKDLAAAQIPLTEAQRISVELWHEQGQSIDDMAKALKISQSAIQAYFSSAKKGEDLAKVAMDDWNESVRQNNKEFKEGEEASLAAIERLKDDGIDAAKAAMEDWNETVKHHHELQQQGEAATLEALKKRSKETMTVLSDLSRALSDLATVSGGTFGTIASGLGTVVSAANTAQKAIDAMKSGLSKDSITGKGKGLEGILELSSGIAGIVSAAVAAGKAVAALFGLFNRNKGRDLVVDFAETFGGFDALHVKLLELGAAGEALWIKLTQGVGRNNPQQAQEVIDEVIKALEEQRQKTEESTGTTEEQAQATIESATEAAKALEELGPKITDNEKIWKDWGDVVTGVLQEIANSIRSLPSLPSPGGGSTSAFSGGGGSTQVQFNSSTYLDGTLITESIARRVLA